MKDIKCVLEVDERSGIVTLRSRYGAILAKIRCDMNGFGTFTRIEETEDCDNYWIAVKPGDSAVFEEGLFDSRKKMSVKQFEFDMK